MLSIDRILWPTGVSDGSMAAFPHAAVLADRHDAALHGLNVREGSPDVRAEMAHQFPLSDDTLTSYMSMEGDPPSETVSDLQVRQKQIDAASPTEAILSYVDEHHVDLVGAGTHGRRGMKRLLLGSVVEEGLRRTPCPVFTIRSAPPVRDVRTILLPVDFSEESEVAVRHARELARLYDARICLLHAIEQMSYPPAYGREPAPVSADNKILRRAERLLTQRANDLLEEVPVDIKCVVGYAASAILEYQREHDVDLVVLSTHGRSGLERLLLGSVTERVVRRATAPAFVVKPFGQSLWPSAGATG